jgi:hypothetical protein
VCSPAGLDLDPSAQEEIAVAILAELVAWWHTRGPSPAELVAETAVDPICGMTVVVADAEYVLEHEGRRTSSAAQAAAASSNPRPSD